MIIAERIVQTLAAIGIRRVYGLPGEDHMTLLDAFEAAGLEYYPAANESSAVIMAAADAKVSGLPGVVVLSLAPGISNGVNGLLHAYMEGLPLLLISGQHPASRAPLVVRQGFDLQRLVEPITKWIGRVSSKSDPQQVLAKAIDVASANQPGPVYIELPDEVARAEEASAPADSAAVTVLQQQWAEFDSGLTQGPTLKEALLNELRKIAGAATHPVLVIGGRAACLKRETVKAFSETLRVPVFTSTNQKGLLAGGDPFYAGTFLNGSMEHAVLDRSDLILAINPEAFDFYNTTWGYVAPTIVISPAVLGEWLFPFSRRLIADPDSLLRDLVVKGLGASRWTSSDVKEYRQKVVAELHGPDIASFSVVSAVEAALSAAPAGTCYTADAGFSKPIAAMLSEPEMPGGFLASNALSTMGFSIPAAIGAARAAGSPILAFLGDGSLLMRASELALAQDIKSPLVVVALMDAALTQIQIKQERRELRSVGVTLPELSCEAVGAAFGVPARDVSSAETLSEAVRSAFASEGPCLIGAHVAVAPSRRVYDLLRG